MPAHRERCGRHRGRRPKASREGTRERWAGDGAASAMGIWASRPGAAMAIGDRLALSRRCRLPFGTAECAKRCATADRGRRIAAREAFDASAVAAGRDQRQQIDDAADRRASVMTCRSCRRSWSTRSAAACSRLEGLDDDHAAAAAGARGGERGSVASSAAASSSGSVAVAGRRSRRAREPARGSPRAVPSASRP